jgi:hypothetical protein
MAKIGGHAFPSSDLPSALTYSLSYFGNAISTGGKNGHRRLGETLRGLLDGFLKIRRIGKVHHLYLFRRKTFGDMDDLKFFSQFLEMMRSQRT